MNVFDEINTWVKDTGFFSNWPDLSLHFEKQCSLQPYGWELGITACNAVGGTATDAVPIVAAYGCVLNSILIVDDILDHDSHGLHSQIGVEKATNISVAFQAAGISLLDFVDMESERKLAVTRKLNEMAYLTSWGQALDVENPKNEEEYWRVVKGKSSPFHETAMFCGAIFGGASYETANQLGKFGALYGEIIQINDDLKDTMDRNINVDWLYGKMTLPILFANIVNYPQKERFLFLQKSISHKGYLEEAQKILLSCGAISYSLDQLLGRYKMLINQVDHIPLKNEASITKLIDDMIYPFKAVMTEIGVEQPEIEKILAFN
jgi:geranylgeranyl pyrophosphate synthase